MGRPALIRHKAARLRRFAMFDVQIVTDGAAPISPAFVQNRRAPAPLPGTNLPPWIARCTMQYNTSENQTGNTKTIDIGILQDIIHATSNSIDLHRSEERRVGKEGRSRRS